jgi:hypothetical protein
MGVEIPEKLKGESGWGIVFVIERDGYLKTIDTFFFIF